MHSASARPFRFLSFSVLPTFFLFIILFGFVDSNHTANVSAETAVSDKVPNLNGEEAKEHLKKQGLYESLGEAMKMARYSINPTKNAPLPNTKDAFEANNPRQAFSTYFAKDGIHLVSKTKNNKWRVQMNLKGYGYSEDITEVEQTKTEVQKNKSRIEITKSAIQNPKSKIVEWYENTANGLEQGWTIREKLNDSANAGELNLALELGGDLQAKLQVNGQAIYFNNKKGESVLRYDKLKSWDADGKELASRMELDDNTLSIVVDDVDAKYPITIDPFFSQTKKLVASDAAAFDQFGISVAISGDTAIVGAFGNDDNGSDSGAAYIFERNTSGSNMWGEVKKLSASDAAADDLFGFSVAISRDTAIVGAYFNDDAPNDSGSAYIFERNSDGAGGVLADNWGEVRKIVANDAAATDQFGFSVGISGDTAIVGAHFNDDGGVNTGSAYIFERNMGGADMWGEVKELNASDAGTFDRFGFSVAISGDTAIVGAYFDDDGGGNSGSAYIFERNSDGAGGTSADNWGEVKKIVASAPAVSDEFGRSVSISNDTVIVGARLDDDDGSGSGSAYIFERNNGGADLWGEVQKLVASDANAGDQFGSSVTISGDSAMVGAISNDDGGSSSGSAYIFERNTSGTDMWGEVQKLVASDAAAGDEFGRSVAISGDQAIVGAYLNDDVPLSSGSAYIYANQDNNWTQIDKALASDGTANDNFGISVSISGDTAIVGAYLDDDGGGSSGSAYIFERNMGGANMWEQVQKLVANDPAANDLFGISVAISGDTAIVGAWLDDDGGIQSGSAYIFERNTGGANVWGQVQKIVANDAAANDFFGSSVAISGDTAIVGADFDDDGGSDSGSAYIFERNTGGANMWGQIQKIVASDAAANDHFGFSVAISGDTAVVGAYLDDDGGTSSGSTYIFERNTGGANMWGQVQKLAASDAAQFDEFGFSVGISGDMAIVGAYFDDDAGTSSGSAYIFERNTGGANMWGQVQKIVANDAAANDNFGGSVAISGDIAIVGAFLDDDVPNDSGSAYLFERNTGGADVWGQVQKIVSNDAAANDNFGRSVSISGDTAIVGARFADIAAPPLSDSKQAKWRKGLSPKSAKQQSRNLAGTDQGAAYVFKALANPTAASANVSGRVTTNIGQGIGWSSVTLADSDGNTQTATTNQFGYFNFSDVGVGETYVLSVGHKVYSFEPSSQVINVGEDITDVRFTGYIN